MAKGPNYVVCFRISRAHRKVLLAQLSDKPVVGVQSLHQLVRKQVLDILEGRATLVYVNEDDRSIDREVYPVTDPEA